MEEIKKGQPTPSSVYVNAPLSNVAIAYMNSTKDFVFNQVFPQVAVDKQTGLYRTYTKNDWLRDEAQLRAPGTESAGGGYGVDHSSTYSCKVYAFHQDVSDQLRANDDFDTDKDATIFVTQKILLKQERVWHTNYFTTSVWGKDYTGVAGVPGANQFVQWSDYTNSDPIADIATGRMYIKSITGKAPNTLVLQEEVFEKLKAHPDIVDRFKYTSDKIVTKDLLARLFEVDRVLVSGVVYATNNEGETGAYSFVGGKGALLCYSAPAPSLYTPSAGYSFVWKGITQGLDLTASIKKIRAELLGSDRIEAQVAVDFKAVATDCGAFFTSAIA